MQAIQIYAQTKQLYSSASLLPSVDKENGITIYHQFSNKNFFKSEAIFQ